MELRWQHAMELGMSGAIVDHLENELESYIADLRTLSAIDSFSYDKRGVDRTQDWLETRLDANGFTIDRRRNADWGDDLVARRRDGGNGRVMLLGHADTVYPEGTCAERPMRIEGDRLLGPGTCD